MLKREKKEIKFEICERLPIVFLNSGTSHRSKRFFKEFTSSTSADTRNIPSVCLPLSWRT